MTWQEIAKALPYGQKRRIAHCGEGSSGVASNAPRGVSMYCFRCGESEFEKHGERSLSEILSARAAMADFTSTAAPYTAGCSLSEAPPHARVWLLKAGITPDEADALGITWSERMSRVLLPVRESAGMVSGSVARAVISGEGPKYLFRGKATIHFARTDGVEPLVLTEDILSAIAVSKVFRSAAVLGTSVSAKNVQELTAVSMRFVLWLDGDKAGVRGSRKIEKALLMQGAEVRVVRTARDPKYYTKAEIQRIVHGDD